MIFTSLCSFIRLSNTQKPSNSALIDKKKLPEITLVSYLIIEFYYLLIRTKQEFKINKISKSRKFRNDVEKQKIIQNKKLNADTLH